MKKIENDNIIERIKSDKELVAEFTSNMQLITKQTGIKLTISTEHNSPAWMRPGDTRVFFNPVYTLRAIQAIQLERAKRLGITENFTFDISHLSQLMLHEINHMINHTQLKMSDKIIKIDKKNMNMIEYEKYLFEKYGKDFQEFQNIMEDIDVNNHATKIQAPVFESANQDIYHHITAPFYDFTKDTLAEQFAWTILRESMLPKEKCIIDQRVRDCIDYLSEPGEDLEKLRDPALNYDEQLPIIHRLYEEYYLRFKEEDKKIQQKRQQEKQQRQQQDTQNGNNQKQQDAQNWNNQEQQNMQNGDNQEQQQNTQNGNNQEQQQDAQNGNNQEQQNMQNGDNQEQQQNTQNGNNQEQQQDTQNGKNQGGLLGRLKKLLEGDKEKGNSQNSSDKSNKANEREDKQGDNQKEEQNPQTGDKQGDNQKEEQNPQTGDKQGDTEQKEESEKTSLRKPVLLPHIFENLDEDGNKLAEELEKSLNGDNNNVDEDSEKDEANTSNEVSERMEDEDENEDEGKDEEEDEMSKKVRETLENLVRNALQQAIEDQSLSPEERSLEATIQQEWDIDGSDRKQIRDIKNAIENQEKLKQLIKKIKDSKGNSVYDKITKDIFSKIVQIRKWNKLGERHARPFSEGGQLDGQNLIKGIMDRKAGDDDPRILKQEYKEQKEKQKAGGFSITFILDGSASMMGEKNRQQTLSTLLMLYSLQQLNQDIKLEGGDMEDFLISTQAIMFCGSGNVAVLKDRGKDLSVKDMIEITSALGYCSGWDTNAGDAIDLYYEQVSKPFERMSQKQYDERRQKVKDGKFKEIVFVLSDGAFHDNPTDTINKLRKMGIIVCGIGITNDGLSIIRYFGKKSDNEENNKQGFGIVCEDAGNLGNTLNELLVQHLEDPSIVG